VDGAQKPTWEGTGTEDFFNNSWYFSSGVLCRAFHGLPHFNEGPPPRMCRPTATFIPDRIGFKTSLRYDMQHGSRNSAPDTLYKSVAFWYQKPPSKASSLPKRRSPSPPPGKRTQARSPSRQAPTVVTPNDPRGPRPCSPRPQATSTSCASGGSRGDVAVAHRPQDAPGRRHANCVSPSERAASLCMTATAPQAICVHTARAGPPRACRTSPPQPVSWRWTSAVSCM